MKTIAVWFSCGAASAVAAKLAIEKYPTCNVRIINNPIAEEDKDNRRFLADVEKWIGQEIEIAINPKFPDASCETVWNYQQYMAGIAGAPCTRDLKKGARQHWENNNHFDFLVMGFTADEKQRHERFIKTEKDNVLPLLINENLTKADCYRIIMKAGIKLPRVYKWGYPNANCIGCVKATSPTYWNHVRKLHPGVFKQRAETSRRLGAKLARHKGKRVFLDELPEDAIGRPMKSMEVECGIFCEEPNQ